MYAALVYVFAVSVTRSVEYKIFLHFGFLLENTALHRKFLDYKIYALVLPVFTLNFVYKKSILCKIAGFLSLSCRFSVWHHVCLIVNKCLCLSDCTFVCLSLFLFVNDLAHLGSSSGRLDVDWIKWNGCKVEQP